jgi:hypothetical protein
MWALWRIFRTLLEQPWAAPAAATVSVLLLAGGGVGSVLHWHSVITFFTWGAIWAVVALGAWVINR